MIIYVNLQSNLSISFREDFLSFCFWLPWQPEFCMDLFGPGYDVKLHPAVTLLLSVGM